MHSIGTNRTVLNQRATIPVIFVSTFERRICSMWMSNQSIPKRSLSVVIIIISIWHLCGIRVLFKIAQIKCTNRCCEYLCISRGYDSNPLINVCTLQYNASSFHLRARMQNIFCLCKLSLWCVFLMTLGISAESQEHYQYTNGIQNNKSDMNLLESFYWGFHRF